MGFETFLIAPDVSAIRKRAILFHYAGEQVQDTFETFSEKGEPNDYDRAVKLLRLFQLKSQCGI